ncbi:S-adenosyl-L-methionine-dependent methyltransferase [Xylariaceae sp. FL0594]|nr:S-adenosyl-L-methionine-dependent methyltransferase [Xylariaceae sp. FL0594]
MLQYRSIHGRPYYSLQSELGIWLPTDEKAFESMDVVHHCVTLLFENKLYLAPIAEEGSIRVLDIGTGTDAHPEAEVIGTDIAPSQPEWVPPNLHFEIEDCTRPWTFPPDSFHFVHLRYLFGCVSDCDALYAEAYKACRPGGWVEACECSVNLRSDDGSVREGTAFYDWGRLFNEASSRAGRTMSMVDDGKIVPSFEKAGFEEITSRLFKLPASPWPRDPRMRELGAFAKLAIAEDLDGYAMYLLTNALGWTREQVLAYLARVRTEFNDMSLHPYFTVQVVYGRKPVR